VIFNAHPKEFTGIKLHQTVFLTGLDKYIGIVCTVQKKALDKGLAPLTYHLNKTLDKLNPIARNLEIFIN